MQWRVVKIGAEMFDMLHASGLAILLAQATLEPVELLDRGADYLLSISGSRVPRAELDLLDHVLLLPPGDKTLREKGEKQGKEGKSASEEPLDLPFANLDGLLTMLFTVPGIRVLSVADVIQNQQRNPLVLAQAIDKVTHALSE